jgi:hypothetical protein
MRDRFAKCEACPFIKASAAAPAAWRYWPQSCTYGKSALSTFMC